MSLSSQSKSLSSPQGTMSLQLLLGLMFTLYMPGEAVRSCQEEPSTAISSRSMNFDGVANRILLGQGYRNVTGVSKLRCGKECLSDGRCFSVHYTAGEKMCELNRASASRFPLALTERTGTYYYGPEKPSVARQLQLQLLECGGPPGLTDCTYQTRALASAECQRADQHLCELWELKLAYDAGYNATMPQGASLWYAVPDSQAVLSGTSVTQHGLPVSVPSLGFCCLGPQLKPRYPLITNVRYSVDDRTGMASGCSALGAHLCTLPELKAAYLKGYRQTQGSYWPFLAMPNRDAKLHEDGCDVYTGSECYEGIVANTPRPVTISEIYCCPNLYCSEPQQLNNQDPFITKESFAVDNRTGMTRHCSALDAHLCTLADLKAAYLRGYRQLFFAWVYCAIPNRDARLFENGCDEYTGLECYEGIVANTPRPYSFNQVYCCPNLE